MVTVDPRALQRGARPPHARLMDFAPPYAVRLRRPARHQRPRAQELSRESARAGLDFMERAADDDVSGSRLPLRGVSRCSPTLALFSSSRVRRST